MAIKRHGGKHYLRHDIIKLMPPRAKNPNAPADDDPGWCHYVEPYYGAGAVHQALDPTGISEVVCDIDGDLTNFWRVLADARSFGKFKRIVEAVPCSVREFRAAQERLAAPRKRPLVRDVWRAVDFFIVNRQSRQAIGKDFTTLTRNRTRQGMNELAAAWLSSIKGLAEVHWRMFRVVILEGPAVPVINQQDGKRTLFYIDPPYPQHTRTVRKAFKHEMTIEDHLTLLECLSGIEGRFILSGYHCPEYDQAAERNGWRMVEIEIDNKSGSGKTKQRRVEVLWMNYGPDGMRV